MPSFAFAILVLPAAFALCPSRDAFLHDNYCYFFLDRSDFPQSQDHDPWRYAEYYCKTLGGHLASVHDAELNELLRMQVQRKPNQLFLIGLRGERKTAGGPFDFKWSDNSSYSYSNWAQDYDGLGRFDVCAAMRYTGQWFLLDRHGSPMNFICKLPNTDP